MIGIYAHFQHGSTKKHNDELHCKNYILLHKTKFARAGAVKISP